MKWRDKLDFDSLLNAFRTRAFFRRILLYYHICYKDYSKKMKEGDQIKIFGFDFCKR